MRKYLFGTGIMGAVVSGVTLLRGARDTEFTWREALAWLSWAITFALAVGAIVDTRRASRGHRVSADSPVSGKEDKLLKKRLRA
ncbi:hypothetical protein [Microbacterium sp. P01]|uniref:hypothetical protein n=1 Tax=unclassified Microbacterium TaxID=2609290 RepID=UPI00366F5D0F